MKNGMTTDAPLPSGAPRVALIGCGTIAERHLLAALRRIGWMPSVIVDPSAARRYAIIQGLGRRHRRSVAMAADWTDVADRFDAAVVAVPHALHAEVGIALARADKHVLMEKPLATSASECHAMLTAAKESGTVLSVGLLRRYLHVARWTKALLEAGVLGDVLRFEAREGSIFNWAGGSASFLDRRMAGGGVLMDIGAHSLDLISWWFGDVQDVAYFDDSHGGVEADCRIELRLRDGVQGRIALSRTRALRNTIRIDGTRGFVEVHLYENEIVAGSPDALAFTFEGFGARHMPPQLITELFDAELRDFRHAVTAGETVGVSAEEGAKSIALIERCYAARRPLSLPWREVPTAAAAASRVPGIAGSTVLVTGGAGFIGGRLVERLIDDYGAQVRCLVRDFGRAARLARYPVSLMRGDLADPATIDRAVAGCDYVFHCAYDTRSRRQNTESVANLIQSCGAHGVKRFVHVSTFSVYEPFAPGLITEETADGDRTWVYADTKLELEKALLEAARAGRVAATVVQPSIVYGPFGKAWTDAPAEQLIHGTVILPDRGQGLCNAVYIDDLIDGMLLAASRPEAIGERFLLAGPHPVSWGQFFDEFARALGVPGPTCWPVERIRGMRSSALDDLRRMARDPRRLIQTAVRIPAVRQALQAGYDGLPPWLRDIVNRHYFNRTSKRAFGELVLPDAQKLALYSAQAMAVSEKARDRLGYRPRYSFANGMAITGQYLAWAYRDTPRALPTPETPVAEDAHLIPGDRAHAG